MIPDLVTIAGARRRVLPPGRYLASLEEIQGKFAPDTDANRAKIWQGFTNFCGLMRQCVEEIAEIWIGGSFITSEEEPHDIDVVFLIKETVYTRVWSTAEGSFALNFLLNKSPRTDIKEKYCVDPYLLVVPPTEMGISPWEYMYLHRRGYWDQFWSKTRFIDENNSRWKYPLAGFLEVEVDGYN